MKDRLYRLWPFQDWELEQQQAWLTDMAKQGWHLHSPGPGLASFKKANPASMRYRCEVAAEENQEQIDLYQAAGWEYVGRRASVLIFRAPVKDEIPEIYTDTTEQALTMRLLKRNLWMNLLVSVIGFAAIALGFLRSPQFVRKQLLEANWLDLLGLLFLVYVLLLSLRGLVHLASLIGKLRHGHSLRQSVPYQQTMRRRQLVVPAILALAVLVITGSVHGWVTDVRVSKFPPIPAGELPMVRLSQLLSGAGYTEYYPSQAGAFLAEQAGGDVFNYYRERGSVLFPVQQELSEMYEVPGIPDPENPEMVYRPTLVTRRYMARTPALARMLGQQLARLDERDLFRMTGLRPAELAGVDGFWRLDSGISHAFIIVKGTVVLDVFYSGVEPIDLLLEMQLARLMSEVDL